MTPEPPVIQLLLGIVACFAALGAAILLVLIPRPQRNSLNRAKSAAPPSPIQLTQLASVTISLVDRLLKRRNLMAGTAARLESAGVTIRPADFVVLTGIVTVLAACVGLILAGPFFAIILAIAAPLLVKVTLGILTSRRQKQFAEQLDDTLQLLAGGLRAGHSLLRAIDAVSADSEAPTTEEFTRIINETRLGRDLGDALDDAADRMQSEDFSWVAQAIAIHREVGGNLAKVLDQVGQTIRERNQIRRQVDTLSAEGKLSAYILMGLPFAMGAILMVVSPGYMDPMFQHPIGYLLIGVSLILLLVGGVWMKKVVSFKF
ncbi:type II secretion system F family protein [Arthrobacter sp. CAN_C5]|uniref:type II secretion system F family protein n=1 Tax=Arthrobacter sp. CAN_C5 TaxID=2760706 RepID=UPI001FDA49FB|nr:type II secretion system F family protein [Arthrobacter sp. CAN_C5]MBP2215726.1 tight adherence protein B [Arthrobacter sp. CAN_C5]